MHDRLIVVGQLKPQVAVSSELDLALLAHHGRRVDDAGSLSSVSVAA
jgi:hypothetical protein